MEGKGNLTLEEAIKKNKQLGAYTNSKAALTHYLHAGKNGVASFFKEEATKHIEQVLAYKFPNETINQAVAERALADMLSTTKKHIPFPKPKEASFSFIDLFAGIGGFRMAMQQLGGKCVFTSEWDEKAKQTYAANYGEIPFGDITDERTKQFIPDGFDVLCAGFPCQAFSIAGRRGGFDDTRGTLFFDVAEIIRRKQPKAIFLENVKGLRNHDKGKTLKTILNVLRNDLNYFVPDPEVINAKNFGVPQNRARIFIVGFRKDLGITDFTYPESSAQKVTFADVKAEQEVSVKYYLSTQYLKTLRAHRARHESKGNGFGYEIIADDAIANAIVVGGMGRERNLVYDDRLTTFEPITNIKGKVNREGIRKMTPREWARLQGYPDEFVIPVSDAAAYKQFGNSVAVPAIHAMGATIISKIVSDDNRK